METGSERGGGGGDPRERREQIRGGLPALVLLSEGPDLSSTHYFERMGIQILN